MNELQLLNHSNVRYQTNCYSLFLFTSILRSEWLKFAIFYYYNWSKWHKKKSNWVDIGSMNEFYCLKWKTPSNDSFKYSDVCVDVWLRTDRVLMNWKWRCIPWQLHCKRNHLDNSFKHTYKYQHNRLIQTTSTSMMKWWQCKSFCCLFILFYWWTKRLIFFFV